ncbi:YraN family protein [Celeribacter indicus]|uniref:Uncharacterized protein n=1 Tax=Celeribacter indicus TaxID=1208324 RepID=A0A0B5E6A0_9RHOB|nr:YraN family protein [Celeribacter indicus]AJE48546.1 hypothetical protein P73_3831 [Celeribacter indicus]SDX08166.1 putative endonuclease [Celeribacter indicus]
MPLDFTDDLAGAGPQEARQARGRRAHDFGRAAEASVARDYGARGYALAETRWRGAGGEIDLIFRDGTGFVFVEVKASKTHARAAEKLGAGQIARICRSAEDYVGRQPDGLLTDMRIDVALVDGQGQVAILENALV